MNNAAWNETAHGQVSGIDAAWRMIFGLSIVVFPVMLLVGFASHPNLLSLATVTDQASWVSEWRGSQWFHIGHLIVMLAVPFILFAGFALASLLRRRGAWYGFVGAVLGVVGAFLLAVDKGALTFVLTAFKDMSDPEIESISLALGAIFHRDGWLWITWGYVALPVGFILIAIGLLREGIIPRWQGYSIILGLSLLLNPDIEIISTVGAALMCAGFIPIGLGVLSGRLTSAAVALGG